MFLFLLFCFDIFYFIKIKKYMPFTITSINTIKIYESVFKNHCLDLCFCNADNDYLSLKNNQKSLNIIKLCFQTVIFYIRYHFGLIEVNKSICQIIEFDTVYLKNSSKINKKLSIDEYKIKLLEYSEYLNGIVNKIKNDKTIIKYPEWKNILNREIIDLSGQDKLIFNLYTLTPPRRINDYFLLFYVSDSNFIIDQTKNYCLIDYDNPENSKFIFYVYKTVKNFGVQIIPIPKKLQKIIIDYVKTENIKDNSSFFPSIKSKTMFIKKVKKIFGFSVDYIRHSYINYLYDKNTSYKKLETISIYMAHDIKQQQKYKKREKL